MSGVTAKPDTLQDLERRQDEVLAELTALEKQLDDLLAQLSPATTGVAANVVSPPAIEPRRTLAA